MKNIGNFRRTKMDEADDRFVGISFVIMDQEKTSVFDACCHVLTQCISKFLLLNDPKSKIKPKEPLRNPYVFRIRRENCYDVISVQVLFFDILLGVDIIDCSQMEISFFYGVLCL